MIIAIFPNKNNLKALEIAKNLSKYIKDKKDATQPIEIAAEDKIAKDLSAKPLSSLKDKEIKFIICIGGDGTILRISHKYCHLNAPIIGINIGNVGFMADIPLNDMYESIDDILKGKYTIENRLMLEVTTPKKEKFFAVNETVLHRSSNHKLVKIALSYGKKHLGTFSADGIILATPNGSTAYSLSAGGPILCPEIDATVLTPICPHTISVRPIVLNSNYEIEMQLLSDTSHPIELLVDGVNSCSIQSGDIIKINKSTKTFNLVKLNRHDYFSTLNTKLRWSGSIYD